MSYATLASAVLENALRDIASEDKLARFDAEQFIDSEDFETWAMLAEVNHRIIRQALTDGNFNATIL